MQQLALSQSLNATLAVSLPMETIWCKWSVPVLIRGYEAE